MKISIDTKALLNDGFRMPVAAFGLCCENAGGKQAVLHALASGYRHIDLVSGTDLQQVKEALEECGIPREELFITVKVKAESVRSDLMTSLENLGTEYADLCLLSMAAEGSADAYKEIEKLIEEKYVHSAGVCGFDVTELNSLLSRVNLIPAVNQIECVPELLKNELILFCRQNKVGVQARLCLKSRQKQMEKIGRLYGKTGAQVMLKWLLERRIAVVSEAADDEEITQNIELFDFDLSTEDHSMINIIYRY